MGWRDILGLQAPPSKPQPGPEAPVSLEKIYFHVARYERAVAQNTKGSERGEVLQRELDYWRSRREAELKRQGG